VKSSQVIEVCRQMAHSWRADASLVDLNVTGPAEAGSINLAANATAMVVTFYSPSSSCGLVITSTYPSGNLFATQTWGPPKTSLLPVPAQVIDLTQAVANARQAGLAGGLARAELSVFQEYGKQPCLAWAIYGQEMYPRVVAGVSGEMLSPFNVTADKVAYYNQLAAEHARNMRGGGSYGGGGYAGGPMPMDAGLAQNTPGDQPAQPGQDVNPPADDHYEKDAAIGRAYWADDPAAVTNIQNDCPTPEQTTTYGGGGEGGE
jgi:hypothetical protein